MKNAWDRIGFESNSGFECSECSTGIYNDGQPMHSVYYSDLGLPTPLTCVICGKTVEHDENPV